MINKDFFIKAFEIAQEREIELDDVLKVMEKAFINSFKRTYNSTSCQVIFNKEKNEILLYHIQKVVSDVSKYNRTDSEYDLISIEDARKIRGKSKAKIGDIIKVSINIKDLGREGAQAAKSVSTQAFKTLERDKSYEYFKERTGDIVNATIIDIKDEIIVLDIGRNITTILNKKELLANDIIEIGKTIKVYIKNVETTTKDPKVIVSRTETNLLLKLLEDTIPEIKDGIVEVMGIAREIGERSKVAVKSNDPYVDAVGSCIGENGERIKYIIDSLKGEKVDIFYYSDDSVEYIKNALKPANIKDVRFDEIDNKKALVIVDSENYLLAIGKQGLNVKLAAFSTGFKLDIKEENN